jgi:copper chaperone
MAQVQETVLPVAHMSCELCVKTINGALGSRAGVESVSIDISSKTVHLRYDPSPISRSTIEATLDDAGYTVAE